MSGIRRVGRGPLVLTVLAALFAFAAPSTARASAVLPELPRVQVDTTYPPVTGRSTSVAAGGDLQGAVNGASPGDEIVLQAGASYGVVTLPVKSGSAWIVIRSSRANELPQGTRVGPADAPKMARIIGGAGSNAAVQTANGAHHYRFVGIEFTVSPGADSTGLVRFGTGSETSLSQMPHHLIVDRCYVHGDPTVGGRRGVALNSGEAAVIDSYISGWHEPGTDTQAIAGWNGPGPYRIENNYLEGASENVMFGGADPTISWLNPSDITFRRNYVAKPTAWRNVGWQVKNLFELKNAVRVLADGNVFENNWGEAQNGTAILFSVRDQDGTAPWTAVNDITFTNNIVRHVASGLKITGRDDTGNVAVQTNRILVRNNVFDDVSSGTWAGDGRMFFLLYGATNVTLDHNTGFPDGAFIATDNSVAFTNHVITNNIGTHGLYGVKADSYGDGLATLNGLFPGYVFSRNAVIGASASSYPADNFYPATTSAMSFVDFAGGNYALSSVSAYRGAGNDGKDVGADMSAINAAIAGSGSTGGGGGGGTPPSSSGLSVSFSNPGANAGVSGTITVSVSASGGSGTGYTYTVKAGATTIYSGTGGSFSWNTATVANGAVTLTASVTDSAGSASSTTRGVSVLNQATGAPVSGAQLQAAQQYALATWPNYKTWDALPQYLKDSAIQVASTAPSSAPASGSSSGALLSSAQQYALQNWPNYKTWDALPQYLKDSAYQAVGGSGAAPSTSSGSGGGSSSGGSGDLASAQQYALQNWPNYKTWDALPQYLKDSAFQAVGGSGSAPSTSSGSSGGSSGGSGDAQAYALQNWPNYKTWDALPQYLKDAAMQATGSSGASSTPSAGSGTTQLQYAMAYATQTWPNYKTWDALPQYLKDSALQQAATVVP